MYPQLPDVPCHRPQPGQNEHFRVRDSPPFSSALGYLRPTFYKFFLKVRVLADGAMSSFLATQPRGRSGLKPSGDQLVCSAAAGVRKRGAPVHF